MKLKNVALAVTLVALSLPAWAGKPKAPAAPAEKLVDEGTFAIFVNGSRVASESFRIQQVGGANTTKSELKLQDGSSTQNYELKMTANATLQRYEWHELQPAKAVNVVEPQADFLVEHYSMADGRIGDQSFLMPASSVILDDFFFSQRQLLLWRYLAAGCATQAPEQPGTCKLERAQFGVVIPRQRISSMVTIEYAGLEQVDLKGTPKALSKFKLSSDGPDWLVWLDENYKVQKISIPESNTIATRE